MNSLKFIQVISFVLLVACSVSSYSEFSPLEHFGENPGELSASVYSNEGVTKNLVVLLHGCSQNGEVFAEESGLLALSKKHVFALLVPQQSKRNNIKTCFNWFSEEDTKVDSGESASIKNMIDAVKAELKIQNVYVVGFSAGGAMASSLLVNYPETFVAGAVVAGVPYPCANSLMSAFSCMKNGPSKPLGGLQGLPEKSLPRLSVWAGEKDRVVNPDNAHALAQHWAELNDLGSPKVVSKTGYEVSRWSDSGQNVQLELVEIENMEHGFPVNSATQYGGVESKYLPESPLSASVHLIDFWGLK